MSRRDSKSIRAYSWPRRPNRFSWALPIGRTDTPGKRQEITWRSGLGGLGRLRHCVCSWGGRAPHPTPLRILTWARTGTYVVAEVARLRGFTPHTRILANSATKILNGVAHPLSRAKQCRKAGQRLFHFCFARRHGSVLQISVFAASGQRGWRVSPQKLKFERLTLAAVSAQFCAAHHLPQP